MFGQLYPIVGSTTANVVLVHGALLGAGAAPMTFPAYGGVASGRAGRGIRSVARTAVGRYTLTLEKASGIVAGLMGGVHTAATVAPLQVKYVEGSLVAGNGVSTFPTVAIEFWDMATPSLADPPLNALVNLDFIFLTSPHP